jgi:hypothetical protein
MSIKKTVLLIEQLNFFTALVFHFFYKNRCESSVYINVSFLFDFFCRTMKRIHLNLDTGLTRIYFRDFPGTWYEQKEETGMHVNDALFEKYSENFFLSSVLKFCGDRKYSLAVRKELYNRYTLNRVKTFVFLKRLSQKNDQVIFIPVDNEEIGTIVSEKQRPDIPVFIPSLIAAILRTKKIFCTIFCILLYPIILCAIAIHFLMNGISLKNGPRKTFAYAIDSFSTGIPWKIPYIAFFVYNKSDFHPSKILHVVRSPLVDLETQKKYEKYHYPYTIWNKQKTPLRLLFSRICGDLLLRQIVHVIVGSFRKNFHPLFFFPCFAVMKMTLETEIFYSYYDIRVFIARDDYSPLHIVRTLVAHTNNSFSIGFMHGDYTVPGIETSSNLLFDNYALFGSFHEKRNKKGLSTCINTEIIGAGIIGLDKTFHLLKKGYFPTKYRDLKSKYKIMLIVGGPFMDKTESCFTRDLMLKYFNDILKLTDKYTDYYRIIKPPVDDKLGEDLKQIIAGHERVIVDHDLWIYKIILISDLTLCYASSTVGLESILIGKKVIFYDLYAYEKHPFGSYSPILVATNTEELQKSLEAIIKKSQYVDEKTLAQIRKNHGTRFDGEVVLRFRQMCRRLLALSDSARKKEKQNAASLSLQNIF